MRILMFTNTYTPHVGGVARSVQSFVEGLRNRGHRVVVVAPPFDGLAGSEMDVIRVPALQHFNGSDFSVPVPVPGYLYSIIRNLDPDVVHSHHPFLLGDTALRVASYWNVPVVFTYHTRYELYTHYVDAESSVLPHFVQGLATGYANLCDATVAPSETLAGILREQGVRGDIRVIPTGIDLTGFASGRRDRFREAFRMASNAFVVGHVGRLAPEKNLSLLCRAVGRVLTARPEARFLVVGAGPESDNIKAMMAENGVADRVHLTGVLQGQDLADAYHAMDAFAFTSVTETQGLVLVEAMACGVPVVALDAPGVRDVMQDGITGYLVDGPDPERMAAAIERIATWSAAERGQITAGLSATVQEFTRDRSVKRLCDLYEMLCIKRALQGTPDEGVLANVMRRLREEYRLVANWTGALDQALFDRGGGRP
jgi:1,2-diacylglycerol 3-alpha-glucosyltransferase